jgi:branched-chain amino acid transport system substrate-binding protein
MENNGKVLMRLLMAFLFVLSVSLYAQAKTYVLGSSLAITGPTSDAGSPYAKGIEDYCKYTNDMKLLGNDKVKCIIRDDAYRTATTKRNFEDFLDKGMVLYLNYSTGSTLGLKKDFEEEKIPVIPASFHAGNLENSNYIFLPIASYSEQAIGLAEYVANHHKGGGVPKIALFLHPSAFGRGPLKDVKKAIKAGLNVKLVEVVEHGKDLEYVAVVKRLIKKGVRYVISQTVQPPVAVLVKDAARLGKAAKTFGERGKLTFMGAHYAGGPDLLILAGAAANNTFWVTSYKLTTEPGAGTDAQLSLGKRYGRDSRISHSHNYSNGIMVTQVAVEAMRRVKAKGMKISKKTLYNELNAMNGLNAYYPLTTVGPVTFSKTDRSGVDSLQMYKAIKGVFLSVGHPFRSKYYNKIK